MSLTVRVRWPGKTAEHLFFLDFLFLLSLSKDLSRKKKDRKRFPDKKLLFYFFLWKKKYPDSHRDLRQKKPPENDLQPVFGNALIELQCYCDFS